MTWNDGLSGVALQIAATNASALRVMAGPGTGKSYAMKRRVARLLEGGQPARRILAVTFTRNAAGSLVDDLLALGVKDCEDVHAGTLHAFCFGMLSRQEVFGYLGRVPRPVVTFQVSGTLQFEGRAMVDDLLGSGPFGPKRNCAKRIRAFEADWARLQSEIPGWPQDPTDRQFQIALLSWLRFHHAILIGELVPEALRYLRSNPNASVLSAFDHVIVDEYQDLNKAEQVLIDLLADAGSTAVVGDVDQSIYSFRHANPEGIANFDAEHPATHDEVLDLCRRCPSSVVQVADHLIRHNHPPGGPARLQPTPTNPAGEIHIVQWQGIEEEADGLARFVDAVVASGRFAPGEILVLTPRRLLGYKIRDNVGARGIAVHSFYQEEALEPEAAQRAFALLTLAVNSEDRVALRWWLGDGSPTSRRGEYRRLREYCEAKGSAPRHVLESVAKGKLSLDGISGLEKRLRELQRKLAKISGKTPEEVVDLLLPLSDPSCSVLRQIASALVPAADDLSELLDGIRTQVTQPELPEEGEFVRVMSLHKAKGLTSKVTIVAGCIEGLIPFQTKGLSPQLELAELQEQRRLFYVAVTRCTELLVVSSASRVARDLAHRMGARVPPGRGREASTIASQFIHELGPSAPRSQRGTEWAASGYSL